MWRGEIARAEGDLASSLQDLDAGITASHGYPIAGHLSRVITVTAAHQRHKGRELLTTHEDAFAELATILAPLLPTLAQSPGGRRLTADLLRDFEQALARMGGNRSTRPTYLEGGPGAEVELRPLDVPVHTRFKARQIQDLLPVRDPEDVIARLQALADERDAEPTIFCHIGEIHLWLGDPDRAEAAFLRAIRDTPEVRWAYVGLCATQLLRDDPQGAVRWCDRGIDAFPPPGRTIYAYRGEAHRRLGELDRAEDDLRQILELTPERISAWLNLALVGSARDDRRMLDPVFRKTARRAPALVDDACHELGLDPLVLPSDDDLVRLFEHILHMMRGNRSSNFVSYFTAAGDLRFVPR